MALTAEQISARDNTYKGLGINFGMPQSSGSPTPPPQGAAPQINRTGSDPNMMYASSAPQESRPVDAPRGYTAEANPAPANSVPFRTDQPSQGQDTIQQGIDMWNNASKMPVASSNATPAPQSQSQGSSPGQLSNSQIYAEAQARIAKQRAAITGATNAANAARKNVFDYTNQLTNDNRTLRNADFNENSNPFSGRTGYLAAQNFRNDNIQDTANNNNYQADITANNQKVTDFETLAPEQQQALIDQLTRTERDYGLQLGALTGQINGQNTMQQNQNNFNNGIALGNLTGNYNGPVGSQGQMSAQGGQQQGVPTLAGKAQSFQQDQQAWQNRFNYGQSTGTFGNGQHTEGFNQDQINNEWKVADESGRITPTLAKMYGIPEGTPTQAAKQFTQSLGIQQQNANTSANSATNTANNTKISQLMQAWKDTGKAPAGLESLGITKDTPFTGGNPSSQGNFNLDDYKGHINTNFYTTQPSDPNNPYSAKTKVFDKAGAQSYVDRLNLPKAQKNQLYQIYGLQAVSDSDISQYLK